jgi:hypothetical protein
MMNRQKWRTYVAIPRLVPCLGGVAVTLLACGAPDHPAAVAYSQRDSVGVRIVEYEAIGSADVSTWRVTSAQGVRFGRTGAGGGDPAEYFGRPVGAVRLAGRGVAVADRMAYAVHVFDDGGRPITSFGRRGEGPGEFTQITGLVAVGRDSLLVLGTGLRWALYDPHGTLLSAGRFLADDARETVPLIAGAFADGTALLRRTIESPDLHQTLSPRVTMVEHWGEYYRVAADGTRLTEFGRYLTSRALHPHGTTGGQPRRAWTTGHSARITPRGAHFYRVAEGIKEVRRYALDGTLELILRFADDALPSEPTSYDERSLPPDMPAEVRADLAGALRRMAAELGGTPFSDFTVDDSGHIWLRESAGDLEEAGSQARWYVFASDGLLEAVADLPARWRARGPANLTVGSDYVLALEHSDLGEETFLLVPLERAASTTPN